MRLSAFAFLFGIGKSQEIDLSGIDLSGIDLSGIDLSGIDLSQVGEICEPTDGDFKSTIDGIKDVIGKIDGPLTTLMMNPDFVALTLIDTMKIAEAIIKNLDKSWCNKVLSAINVGLQSEVTMQQIKDLTRDLVGTIMSILRSLGVNPQVGRLVAMAELEKEFVLGNADLKGLFPDDFWPTIEGIVSSIDFNYEYTASTANLDECGVMDEILPWVETAKPLVVGLISDFNDAFRGKEGLLSIGNMAFFDYRLAKHLLFNKSACQKLIDGASGLVAEIENVDLTSIIDPEAVSGISGITDIAGIFARAASENSMTSDMIKLIGDFVKSETPPNGAMPLNYDIHKMSQMGKTMMEAAPKMMMTVKTKAGPIIEKAGIPQDQINAIMDAIKEEDVKSFAAEMSAELEKSSNGMICGGQTTCAELTTFQAQVAKENVEAAALPGNGSGRTVLSFGATFLTIISLIYA